MTAAHYLRTLDDAGTEAAARALAVVDPGADAHFIESDSAKLERISRILLRKYLEEREKVSEARRLNPGSEERKSRLRYACGRYDMLLWLLEMMDLTEQAYNQDGVSRNG